MIWRAFGMGFYLVCAANRPQPDLDDRFHLLKEVGFEQHGQYQIYSQKSVEFTF